MDPQPPNADAPDAPNAPDSDTADTNSAATNTAEAIVDEASALSAETHGSSRAKRMKIAIGVGVALVVWIVAMIVKGMEESDADAGLDALGRQKPGIKVVELDDPAAPKSDDTNGDRPKKPQYAELLIEIDKLDATVWAREVKAQRIEAAIVKLWDDLRAADDKMAVLESALGQDTTLILGSLGRAEEVGVGIRHIKLSEPEKTYTADGTRTLYIGRVASTTENVDGAFPTLFARFRAAGYAVEQIELRHVDFKPYNHGSERGVSTVVMVIDAHGPQQRRRVTIRGEITVRWGHEKLDDDDAGFPNIDSVDASQLTLTVRDAPPAFVPSLVVESAKPRTRSERLLYRRSWPVILDDLDGDGLPELILGGRNIVYPNLGGGKFGDPRTFCPQMPLISSAGLIADFSGDGRRDFLCFDLRGRLLMFAGAGKGDFSTAEPVGQVELKLPRAMTAGDIDGDGDLDLYVGQYKKPWIGGQMPTPYYDANDGEPAYLLRNENGKFTDVTDQSGLAAKRHRRSYGASLVDLDDDGNLDLLVSSDFAGVDLYRGDGTGRFTDVTATMLGERHGLSAAHTFADFDADGRLDFFVAAESSHVVRRLDRLGVGRTDRPEATKMRTAMGYGNRMFLARDGRFEPPPLADQLAETGAPLGCVSFDVENDGDVDLYIANGRNSGDSAADVGSNFWRHGIYLGSSEPESSVKLIFDHLFLDPLRAGESHNGFQHNALLANRGDEGFVDVAYALGVASEHDGMATVAGDVDNDGRVDLILMDRRIEDRFPLDTVYVLRNTIESDGHWIGVRLHNAPSGRSPIGAKVTIAAGGKRRTAAVVTGDSFASQLGPVVHFGLGATASVDKLEIRWPDGKIDTLTGPAIDRYHDVGQRADTSASAAP